MPPGKVKINLKISLERCWRLPNGSLGGARGSKNLKNLIFEFGPGIGPKNRPDSEKRTQKSERRRKRFEKSIFRTLISRLLLIFGYFRLFSVIQGDIRAYMAFNLRQRG